MDARKKDLKSPCEQFESDKLSFLFGSPYQSIRAFGICTKLTVPAINGEHLHSDIQQRIAEAFRYAQTRGIARPIMVGAIPFDVTKPSCLYVPENYQMVSDRKIDQVHCQPEHHPTIINEHCIPGEQRFKQSVRQAIANFQLSDIKKTVLSQIREFELSAEADIEQIFQRLIHQNPSAYHFRLPLQAGIELIGASPELLIRKEGAAITSQPLAGSAKRHADALKDADLSKHLLASQKDTYEHQLVVDEIRNAIAVYCDRLEVPVEPSLMCTPTMWHLSTLIKAKLVDPTVNVLQLACKLHPTPAVCGFPTQQARKLINLIEPFDRGFFSGMVGWSDMEGNGEWVVTIRCGTIEKHRIRLFAGAGIVENSDPTLEWLETQAKLQTMCNSLGINH